MVTVNCLGEFLMSRLPVIGLTGGIASGKSLVAALMEAGGALVSDADQLAHEALEDPSIREAILEKWGPAVLAESGRIAREELAERVFKDSDARQHLESLVHPWIRKRREALFENPPPGTVALVIDAPLLQEAGLAGECDVVLHIEAPHSTRQERACRERKWSRRELDRREDSQMSLDEKRSLADYVLYNDGDRASLDARVHALLQKILGEFPPPSSDRLVDPDVWGIRACGPGLNRPPELVPSAHSEPMPGAGTLQILFIIPAQQARTPGGSMPPTASRQD